MKRTIEQWNKCEPSAMVHQSDAALQYAFEDAKNDILELHKKNVDFGKLLLMAAYPRRGTGEESMSICDFANAVQFIFTADQLRCED